MLSAALWSREDMESKFSHSAAIYEIHKSLRFLMRGGEQWDTSVKKTITMNTTLFHRFSSPLCGVH